MGRSPATLLPEVAMRNRLLVALVLFIAVLIALRWGKPTVRVGMHRNEVEAIAGAPKEYLADSSVTYHVWYQKTNPFGIRHTTKVDYDWDDWVVESRTAYSYDISWLLPAR
jgi:hypothetical protein